MHTRRPGRLTLPAVLLLLLVGLAAVPAPALAEASPSAAASDAKVIYRVGLQSEVAT